MGLPKPALRMLAIEHERMPFEGTIVTLGRQCVYATLAECKQILVDVAVTPRELPSESETQTQIPSWRGTSRERYTTDRAFFSLLGVEDCIALDCSDYEGAEITFDLNNPLDEKLHARADVLIDGGTLEHVFDVRQALANVSLLVKPGGRIIHMSPANNYANHGFYQFSPTLYADYYRANRFANVRVFAVEERLRGDETASWDVFELEPGRQPLMMTSATRRRPNSIEL
jgi:SAM-dependent methyltransferase